MQTTKPKISLQTEDLHIRFLSAREILIMSSRLPISTITNYNSCNEMSDWITAKICDSISCDYVTFCWTMCGFMRIEALQFESRLQMCIRMGIIIFKMIIWGGISSDIRPKTRFTALLTHCRKQFPTVYPTIYLPK